MQAVAALHDTAPNPVPVDRPGLGMAWTRQFVPFHRSASPTVMLLPLLLPLLPPVRAAPAACPAGELIVTAPTAVQAPGAVQDTARNWLPVAPAFHASASSTVEPLVVL